MKMCVCVCESVRVCVCVRENECARTSMYECEDVSECVLFYPVSVFNVNLKAQIKKPKKPTSKH